MVGFLDRYRCHGLFLQALHHTKYRLLLPYPAWSCQILPILLWSFKVHLSSKWTPRHFKRWNNFHSTIPFSCTQRRNILMRNIPSFHQSKPFQLRPFDRQRQTIHISYSIGKNGASFDKLSALYGRLTRYPNYYKLNIFKSRVNLWVILQWFLNLVSD